LPDRTESRQDNGNAREAGIEADAVLLQITPHATGGFETKSASAREHDAVDFVHNMARMKRINLHRSRCGPTNIHAAHGTGTAKHHRAPG